MSATQTRFVRLDSRTPSKPGRFPVTVNDGHGISTSHMTPAQILRYAQLGYRIDDRTDQK